MKKEHPYADILRAIADGETIQVATNSDGWLNVMSKYLIRDIGMDEAQDPRKYRIKPKTININGHEIEAPLLVAPKQHEPYWMADIQDPEMCSLAQWDNTAFDRRNLQRGLCHATKEAAAAHGLALASFTEVKE